MMVRQRRMFNDLARVMKRGGGRFGEKGSRGRRRVGRGERGMKVGGRKKSWMGSEKRVLIFGIFFLKKLSDLKDIQYFPFFDVFEIGRVFS